MLRERAAHGAFTGEFALPVDIQRGEAVTVRGVGGWIRPVKDIVRRHIQQLAAVVTAGLGHVLRAVPVDGKHLLAVFRQLRAVHVRPCGAVDDRVRLHAGKERLHSRCIAEVCLHIRRRVCAAALRRAPDGDAAMTAPA